MLPSHDVLISPIVPAMILPSHQKDLHVGSIKMVARQSHFSIHAFGQLKWIRRHTLPTEIVEETGGYPQLTLQAGIIWYIVTKTSSVTYTADDVFVQALTVSPLVSTEEQHHSKKVRSNDK